MESSVLTYVLIAVAAFVLGRLSVRIKGLAREPALEERRKAVNDYLANMSEQQRAEIYSLIADNQKLAAIKAFRQMTGAGLREAKAGVERIAARVLH